MANYQTCQISSGNISVKQKAPAAVLLNSSQELTKQRWLKRSKIIVRFKNMRIVTPLGPVGLIH